MAASTRPSNPARRPGSRSVLRGHARATNGLPAPAAADVGTVVSHAVGAALLAAVIGLAIALIVSVGTWALAPHGSGTGADASVRLAVLGWLLSHHVAIDVPVGVLSLTPLGLVLLPGLLCYAAGRQLNRSLQPGDLGAVGRIAGLFALAYGVVVAAAAGLAAGDGLRPHTLGAWLAGSLVGLAAGGLGLLRASGQLSELTGRMPTGLRQVLAGAGAAVAGLVGVGALLLALMLTVTFPEALEITRAIDADLVGGILVAVLGAVPAAEPGGLGAVVHHRGGLLTGGGWLRHPAGRGVRAAAGAAPPGRGPPEGQLPAWALTALLVPVAAGALAGVVVHRRSSGQPPETVAGSAAVAGLLAGAAVGFLAWASAGSLGGDRLAFVGPTGWLVGLLAAFEMSLAAAVVAWESHRRQWDGRVRMPAGVRGRTRRTQG